MWNLFNKGGAHLFVKKNKSCPFRIIEQIKYFCSKKCMDIVGLSDKTIEFLFKMNFIYSEIDLYTFNFDKLINLKGFKLKKIDIFKNSIENSKKRPFRKLFLSMSIREVGENTIELLIANNLNSFDVISTLCKDKENALVELFKD